MSRAGADHDLVGRARETKKLRQLLTVHRMVSVTGHAGVGKSRLAHAVAVVTADGPWRRIVHVRGTRTGPLSPGALASAVVRALGGPGAASGPAGPDAVGAVRALRDARILLFLDDVDPVRTECTGLAQRLLMAVPDVRILVTSRRPLGLGHERVLRLGGLRFGETGGDRSAPAVELFLARARARVPGFAPRGTELWAVREVCRLLEGNPLAIELAAGQLADRPVTRLPSLLAHQQDRLARAHYLLCTPELRTVWARAGVFAGSFTESTAVFLCTGGGVAEHRVPGALARLAALGILERVGDPGGRGRPRYRMARSAREFGAERLREMGEFAVTAERRMAHGRRVAAVAEHLWSAGGQRQAVRLVLDEYEELTDTVRCALARPEHAEAALEMVTGLWFWWAVYDRAEEGLGYLLRLLPHCEPDGPAVARAQWLAAWLAAPHDPRTARVLLGRAWPAAVLAGDDALIGRIAHVQGVLALEQGDAHGAAEHFRFAADTIPDDAPAGPSPAVSRAVLAMVQAGFAPGAARRSARRALAHPGIRDDAWATLLARYARAAADHRCGRPGRAWQRARRALATVEARLPAPLGRAALAQLVADVEAGLPAGPRRPAPPSPRTEVRLPDPAASPSRR
ncbi:ATP-binding protein [Streptomyces sp. NPDC001270]|uniref:ATP-binding protein n=1 Tax=Streptomyces sp. NPDC001270 TaxID=3364554 RepID=UPI0036C9A212